jgi:hypothetical protein
MEDAIGIKMIRHIISLLAIIVVVLNSCKSTATSPEISPGNSLNDFNEIANQLERAYQRGSQGALDTVFTAWRQVIPSYTIDEINSLSDTVRQVYDVFRSFYSPTDLNRITGGEHENFETDFRYIIVQNSLYFAVVDTNPRYYYYKGVKSWEGVVPDFRPWPDETAFPIVYLSTLADSMIYQFLYQPDGTPKPDHLQRVDFLREAMQLTHHHWIDDYHKATMPIVSHIYLNESLTEALVTFRVFYQFGQAYLERSNNGWVLIHSELTAIE